jgi:aryl-alcohol dehydrogenase-like predicted oxidoreductase
MNRLALGTVQFGLPYGIANQLGQVTRPEAMAMLQLAAENSIDTLDTAIAYGESEACLGGVGTQSFKVVTKLPAVPENDTDVSEWVNQQLSESLSRLGCTSIYGLLLHRPEQLLSPNGEKLYKALQILKDKGQVQKVGVSIYSPDELNALMPRYHFDLVQAPFNLVDQRLSSTGWMRRLKDLDVEIHTRSSFLQGLLLMRKAEIPAKFLPWDRLWQTWHKWLDDHSVSAVQACLAFSLSFPEIDRVVVGADSKRQLAQIIDAAKSERIIDMPNLKCDDENLINPARWRIL